MNYPLISEYVDAIQSAEDNFNKLSDLRPVFDDNGNPVMSSGNFAVVFKMRDVKTNKLYAIKCFLKEQEGREEAYKQISSTLKKNKSPYLVSTKYLSNELFVDSDQTDDEDFPILLMDWIEGIPLDKYIEKFSGNPFELYELCYNFRIMAQWLLKQDFAHGDIKPDNILICEDGQIVLIDYDGMYVSSMYGKESRENGSPDYRHPFKSLSFDKHIDDFALSVIALSLKAISISYYIKHMNNNRTGLLFSKDDYINLNESKLFSFINNLILTEPELGLYYSTFIKCYSGNHLTAQDFEYSEEKNLDELLQYWPSNIFISKYDKIKKGLLSDDGIIYTKDGKGVIGIDETHIKSNDIKIKEGTIYIYENTFSGYNGSKINLHLPSTLRYFNSKSLNYKCESISWDSPWFTYENGCIFTKDKTECVLKFLTQSKFNDNTSIIGAYFFADIYFDGVWPSKINKIRHDAFSNSTLPEKLILPESLVIIGKGAFRASNIQEITFPSTLRTICGWSFHLCSNLESVIFNSKSLVSEINNNTFCNCKRLKRIEFTDSIKRIGESAFLWCESIEDLHLPNELEIIGKQAFCMSDSFTNENLTSKVSKINFPPLLKMIGEESFRGNKNLKEISFSSEIDEIDASAFRDCSNLTKISYIEIHKINEWAFSGCNICLTITDGIKFIASGALNGCSITLKNSTYFVIDGQALYTKDYKSLIYYWGDNDTFELHNGIRSIDFKPFWKKPTTLILPSSYDEDFVEDACFCPIIIVPAHFTSVGRMKNSILSYSKLFIDNEGVLYSEDKKTLINFPMSITLQSYSINSECEIIADNAFEGDEDCDPEFGMFYLGNQLKTLIIPESVKLIGNRSFEGCRDIEVLYIPNSVIEIGIEAFRGCLSLKKIRLSKNLIKLGENALPKKIQEIDCNSESFNIIDKCLLSNKNELLWIPLELQELNLPRKIIYKHEKCITYNNCIVSISGSLLWTIHNVADFEFPEGIVKIDSGAFYGNTNIQTIKIPYGVKRIEKGAFGYNQNLKSIYLPSSIEYIGNIHTYQGRGRKYIEFFYPKEIHIPKGMKKYFLNLLPGIQETNLIDDYSLNE